MSMTDREICEKIESVGHCGGIDCSGDECPLSVTYGNGDCQKYDSAIAAKHWLKDNPKPKAKMITREELIEKCRGKIFTAANECQYKEMVRLAESTGAEVYNSGNSCFDDYKSLTLSGRGEGFDFSATRGVGVTATEFLSWFNTEEKVEVKTYPEELKFKSRKDFLLARIKQIETHKKEFNQTIDKQIESLQKEMTCDGCYIQEDGQYKINESRVNSETAVEVAEFINRMEADFE